MQISAKLINKKNENSVELKTDNIFRTTKIPSKKSGYGSSVNEGKFLFLALASCYCNVLYCEADKQGIEVETLEGKSDFDSESLPASNIIYSAKVKAKAKRDEIIELINLTDKVTEIQNTLREGVPVTLVNAEAISI